MTEINNKGIEYYHSRLEETIVVCRLWGRDLIDKNMDVIKNLVNGYNQFKNEKGYEPSLVRAIETFILNPLPN